MKKADLITAVADCANCTKGQAERIIGAISAVAADTIAAGNDFAIPGVVRLRVKPRAASVGRNPATGEAVNIPAGKTVRATVPVGLKRMA